LDRIVYVVWDEFMYALTAPCSRARQNSGVLWSYGPLDLKSGDFPSVGDVYLCALEAFRGHTASIAMTSASLSFGAWYAFGPAAFAPVEAPPKPALKLLDESRIGPGAASRHMTHQAFVLLRDTFPQERAPVAQWSKMGIDRTPRWVM